MTYKPPKSEMLSLFKLPNPNPDTQCLLVLEDMSLFGELGTEARMQRFGLSSQAALMEGHPNNTNAQKEQRPGALPSYSVLHVCVPTAGICDSIFPAAFARGKGIKR